MPTVDDAFPSKYLKAASLQGHSVPVIVDRIAFEEVEKGKPKPILYFKGKEKGMVLNKTNATNIARLYGEEMNDWVGQKLILFEAMVDFKGETVPALRVRGEQPKDRPRPAPKQENNARVYNDTGMNDDIPF